MQAALLDQVREAVEAFKANCLSVGMSEQTWAADLTIELSPVLVERWLIAEGELSGLFGARMVIREDLPEYSIYIESGRTATIAHLSEYALKNAEQLPVLPRTAVYVVQQSIGSWDRSFGGFYHRWGSPNVFSSVEKAVEFLRWSYTEYSNWHAPVPDPVQDEGAPDDWWIELQVPEPGFMSAERGEDPTKALIRIQRQFVDGLMEQIRRAE